MRKIQIIITTGALLLGAVTAAGCSMFNSSGARTEETKSSVEQALAQGASESATESATESTKRTDLLPPQAYEIYGEPEEGIDIDLTVMSGTMVYSEVYNMMNEPEKYIGKSVKMQGAFAVYEDEFNGENVYACIVKDAAACCATGIEFIREGEHTYPDDYPKNGNEIVVRGVFDVYEDGDYKYCTLKNADMQVV